MSNLPIQFTDKENSPALLAFMQQFGEHTYVDAELINKFRDAINEIHSSLSPDRIISLGTETIDGNEHTYEDYTWQLGGVQVNNIGNPSVIVIPSSTIGFKRKDISVFTASGTIERVAGTETDGEVVTSPDVPEGTLYYKSYDIDGDTIGVDPEPSPIKSKLVEGYKTGVDFYEDALHTILITPETGKLYISISENKAYRWSGSAYVQLSGGIDFPIDGKTYGVKDGLAVRVEEHDLFNPYTSDYFIGTTRPSGTSFILSGFNSSWVNVGTLEAFSEVSEYTLVGVKSAITAGSSCQFTGNYVVRTYSVPRLNKLIQWQIFRNSDASFVAYARFFVGIINKFTPIGNTNPSTNFDLIGVGADSGDTNIQVIHNDQSGVATKIDLGVNFPANTQNVDTYLVQMFFDIPNTKAYIRLVRLNTGHEVITEITTNLPAMNAGRDLAPVFWRNNGTDALEVKMRIGSYLQAQKMM